VTLPVILVSVIELAIMINLGTAYYTGSRLSFIAPIVIGTIQLGATVDYAILMTTRYRTERSSGQTKKNAIGIALSTSIKSVITSALGFFAATVGVALYSDIGLISELCMLLARGALISMVIVIPCCPPCSWYSTSSFAGPAQAFHLKERRRASAAIFSEQCDIKER
jgi:predicted RND superfamily exporter protein